MNIRSFCCLSLALTCAGTGTYASEGRDEIKLLTLDEVKGIWSASYKRIGEKSDAVEKIIDRMWQEREMGTNLAVVAEIEQYLLDEALKIPEGTAKDFDRAVAVAPYEMERYIWKLSRFDCVKEDDNLLKIARTLQRFQPLEEVDKGAVLPFAFKVDDYLAYGTNDPPRRLLWSHRGWKGSACSHVHDVAAFRLEYNRNVRDMRKRVLGICRGVIFDERGKSRDETSRQALWEEFVRVSGVTLEER